MAKKAKQWKSLGLPSAPDDDQGDWFQSMLALKDERKGRPLLKLADEYAEVLEELDIIDKRRSHLTAVREALDRLILENLDAQGLDQVKIAGQTFSERVDVETTVEDRTAFIAWILQTQPELITVNAGHVKSIAKEALDPEIALTMTPAQRSALGIGEPGSNKLPPGVVARQRRTLGRVASKR